MKGATCGFLSPLTENFCEAFFVQFELTLPHPSKNIAIVTHSLCDSGQPADSPPAMTAGAAATQAFPGTPATHAAGPQLGQGLGGCLSTERRSRVTAVTQLTSPGMP